MGKIYLADKDHTHTASDVGAYTKKEIDALLENVAPEFTINGKSPDENGAIELNATDVNALPLKGSGYITSYPTKEGFFRVAGDPVFENMTPDSPYGLLIMFGAVYKLHLFITSQGSLYWGYTDNYTEPSEWHEAATAEEVLNLLPLTGGTLTGDLLIEKTFPRLNLRNPKTGRSMSFLTSDNYIEIVNELNTTNSRGIRIKPETADVAGSVYIDEFVGGLHKSYKLFGEHNKPSGSYTGNGSATARTIPTGGIGKCVIIYGSYYYFAILHPDGGVSFNNATGKTFYYGSTKANFVEGNIYLAISDDINTSGDTFYYQVL